MWSSTHWCNLGNSSGLSCRFIRNQVINVKAYLVPPHTMVITMWLDKYHMISSGECKWLFCSRHLMASRWVDAYKWLPQWLNVGQESTKWVFTVHAPSIIHAARFILPTKPPMHPSTVRNPLWFSCGWNTHWVDVRFHLGNLPCKIKVRLRFHIGNLSSKL